ncbi:MAG: N-acetylmuramoyl-L-alanine amidase [Flavobacteriaceae bacterium]|nr:N-acetylmuramoyl-L-alanine amidase [Flavobacteriaceae bacterium]
MPLVLKYVSRLTRVFALCMLSVFIWIGSIGSTIVLAQNKPFVVVIDPGHGGKDPGNLGNGFKEKDIVLDVSMQVGALLQQQGVEVIYTRKKDVFIELYDRAPVANKADADLFVSIHCDSHNSQAHGAGTFVMGLSKSDKNLNTAKKENEVIFLEENYQERYKGFDPSSPESLIGLTLLQEEYLDQSIRLAGLIQKNLVQNLKRKDRSVRQDVFWVLHHSYMPSVLIELGFLTNDNEGPYLNSKKGRKEMAQEIARSILEYKTEIDFANQNQVIIPNLSQGEGSEPDKSQNQNTSESSGNGGPDKTQPGTSNKEILFKVQIAASSKKLETKSYNFKGLDQISRSKDGTLYRYYYGETSEYTQAQRLQSEARASGYDQAYIVAFKENERVSLSEVLNN